MEADLRPAWMVEQLMREYGLGEEEALAVLTGDLEVIEMKEDETETRHVRLSLPPDPERDTRPERDEWTIYCSKEGEIFITVGDGPFSPQSAEELAAAVVKAAAKVRARTE